MNDSTAHCPNRGNPIGLGHALTAHPRAEAEAAVAAERQRQLASAAEQARRAAEPRLRLEIDAQLRGNAGAADRAVALGGSAE